MKKLFTIILVVLAICIVLVSVFILTFDANRYKPLLVEKIERLINKDVKIGNISLSIFPMLALKIDEFSVKDSNKRWKDAILNSSGILVRVMPLPLIKRDIKIQEFRVKRLDIVPSKKLGVEYTLEDIQLKAEKIGDDILIHRLSGFIAGGSFLIRGRINDISFNQYSDIEIRFEDIQIDKLLPELRATKVQFKGILNLDLVCSSRGFDIEKLLDALSAKGTLDIEEAQLKNINVLRSVFKRLTMLSFSAEKLEDRLPKAYKRLLKENRTSFKPIKADFSIADRKISFGQLVLDSGAFRLIGKGYLSIDRDINVHSDLFISQDVSSAFIGEVRELKYLEDSQGMIKIPVDIAGRLPDVRIRPDLDYVIRKLAVSKGRELIENIFEKTVTSNTQDSRGIPIEQKKKDEPARVIIKTLLDLITAPKD